MSAYDYVRLNHALFAEDQGETGTCYETMAPFMEEYEITPEGRFLKDEVHYEDRSDPAAKGLFALQGAMTPIRSGLKIDQEWHGCVNISTAKHEWHCHFKNGILVSVEDFDMSKQVSGSGPVSP